MKKYGAPLKAIFPGRCFRNEALDASHENTFFQMEGMMIDKNVSIANLIYFMKTLLSEVFKKEVEVRYVDREVEIGREKVKKGKHLKNIYNGTTEPKTCIITR